MNTDHLQSLRPGVFVNPSDPSADYKRMQYHATEPISPIHEADALVRAGQYKRAKDIYVRLLQHKESFGIHQKLAQILSHEEADRMIDKYWRYKAVRQLYQSRSESFGARPSRNRAPAWLPWLLLIVALALIASSGLFIYHKITYTVHENVQTTIQNTIRHISAMPSTHFTHKLALPAVSTKAIVQTVDASVMQANTPYQLQFHGHVEGYATTDGHDQYTISLVGSASHHASLTAAPNISSLNLNIARTAYDYYLQTHQNVPPTSLTALSGMVPASVKLNAIHYKSTANPATALTTLGAPVPFSKPEIYINLKRRTLQLKANGHTLLKAPIGIGNQKSPTPTGSFVVTGRMVNHLSNVYGKYIFPLNQSHYAIHGTNLPTRIGQSDSIGCVELSNQVLQKLYDTIPVGTEVVIQDGSQPQAPTWFK